MLYSPQVWITVFLGMLLTRDKISNHSSLHPFCCGGWLSSDRPPLQTGIFRIFVFKGVFVWPKLLAATLLLFVVSILLSALRNHAPISAGGTVLAAVSLGLAMLALLLPWIAYQKFVDPPGNRLPKMHLAGVISIDNLGVTQTVIDAYRRKTPSKVVRLKLSNLENLLGSKPFDSFGLTALRFNPTIHLDHAQTESSRVAQREYSWNAVGLNLGWIAVIAGLIGRRKLKPVVPSSTWLIAAAVFNLIIWSFILFGPEATYTTHSSYARHSSARDRLDRMVVEPALRRRDRAPMPAAI